jgi:hypothetical protein
MKTPDFKTVLSDLKEMYVRTADDDFDFEIDPQTSPIEKVFVAAMMVSHWEPSTRLGELEYSSAASLIRDAGLDRDDDRHFLENPQRVYGWLRTQNHAAVTQPTLVLTDGRRIRPDVAFVLGPEHATKVIVELDGHDFHERTPEQAQKDKSRDRVLQTMGWHVMRFTGREVLRNPHQCIGEVEGLLRAKLIAANGRMRREENEQ